MMFHFPTVNILHLVRHHHSSILCCMLMHKKTSFLGVLEGLECIHKPFPSYHSPLSSRPVRKPGVFVDDWH